jgi:hypothetical protein
MGIMYCFNFYILDLLTCLFGCESQLLGFYNDDVFYIFRVWFYNKCVWFCFFETCMFFFGGGGVGGGLGG